MWDPVGAYVPSDAPVKIGTPPIRRVHKRRMVLLDEEARDLHTLSST